MSTFVQADLGFASGAHLMGTFALDAGDLGGDGHGDLVLGGSAQISLGEFASSPAIFFARSGVART